MAAHDIKYYWGANELHIELRMQQDRSLRLWYLIELLLCIGVCTMVSLHTYFYAQGWANIGGWVATLGLALVAVYRFIARQYSHEKLHLTEDTLTLIQANPFYKKSHHYFFKHMGYWHYIGKEARTAHPLKGYHYDFLGIDSNDTLLQNIYHKGNLLFGYKGQPVRFGKYVYSWHAEELIHMIQLFTGSKLKLGKEWDEIISEPHWEEEGMQ